MQQVRGKFNPYPVWKWNAEIAENCHLCSLLLHKKGYYFDALLQHIRASGNLRKEVLYDLKTSSENIQSRLFLESFEISISSEGYPSLSRAYITFQEGTSDIVDVILREARY